MRVFSLEDLLLAGRELDCLLVVHLRLGVIGRSVIFGELSEDPVIFGELSGEHAYTWKILCSSGSIYNRRQVMSIAHGVNQWNTMHVSYIHNTYKHKNMGMRIAWGRPVASLITRAHMSNMGMRVA